MQVDQPVQLAQPVVQPVVQPALSPVAPNNAPNRLGRRIHRFSDLEDRYICLKYEQMMLMDPEAKKQATAATVTAFLQSRNCAVTRAGVYTRYSRMETKYRRCKMPEKHGGQWWLTDEQAALLGIPRG